jgi:phospho-2-dehydro-3-deoxyheptonate aldolase
MNNISHIEKVLQEDVNKALTHHWAMDSLAADDLARQLSAEESDIILSFVDGLDPDAVKQRDINRKLIGDRFTGKTATKLFFEGPCSEDMGVEFGDFFDFIEELHAQHEDVIHGVRLNGAKPRSGGKSWKGLWYSTNPDERNRSLQIKLEAFNRGLPVITEITEAPQLGAFAPLLSGVWVGARDVEGTALRGTLSAIHLPVGIKNPRDGSPKVVESAIDMVRSNTFDNQGSGVDIGTIASGPDNRGVPTGILSVGEGNPQNAIFARGYELHKAMTKEERRHAAIKHLSAMCTLGAQLGCAVIIDGSHGVPPMFDIPRDDPDRFLSVLEEIHMAIKQGEIESTKQIAGVIGEMGPVEGRTDKNLVLDDKKKARLGKLVNITIDLL